MLAEDMVPEAARRREYLATLRAEAERLSHLVENVLSYARLEGDGARQQAETVTVADLIARVRNRLDDRLRQTGMDLAVEVPADAERTRVRTHVGSLEQILMNLVDNACKYAVGAKDPRVHLTVAVIDSAVLLAVRDHGPGIPSAEARRLFRSFSKSARRAADSAPGVGLGLALSRRLARRMGGDLRLDETCTDGARFVLTLPAA
jgi:signal transduction histidine kinase